MLTSGRAVCSLTSLPVMNTMKVEHSISNIFTLEEKSSVGLCNGHYIVKPDRHSTRMGLFVRLMKFTTWATNMLTYRLFRMVTAVLKLQHH